MMGSAMDSVLMLFTLYGFDLVLLKRNPRARFAIGISLIRLIGIFYFAAGFWVLQAVSYYRPWSLRS